LCITPWNTFSFIAELLRVVAPGNTGKRMGTDVDILKIGKPGIVLTR
jgi:hypothetical protein